MTYLINPEVLWKFCIKFCVNFVSQNVSEISNCNGLAVDSEAGVLYFTSWFDNEKYASISVTNVDGLYRQTIIDSITTPALRKPEGLSLDMQQGYFFQMLF